MGQHKHNPNCQLAKEGKLPPKRRRMGKRELERLLYQRLMDKAIRNVVQKSKEETYGQA